MPFERPAILVVVTLNAGHILELSKCLAMGSMLRLGHVRQPCWIKTVHFLNTVTHGNCSMHASDTWGWDGRWEWGQYKPVGGRRMGGSWYSVYSVETGSGLVLVFHGVITFRKSVLVRILMNFTVRGVSLKCQTKTTSAVARAEKTQFRDERNWEPIDQIRPGGCCFSDYWLDNITIYSSVNSPHVIGLETLQANGQRQRTRNCYYY